MGSGGAVAQRGGGSLTREQFLMREMRIVADLRVRDLSDEEIADLVKRDNLFQYPTAREITSKLRACLCRLNAAGPELAELIARGSAEQAAQTNLYTMMRVYHLVLRFMLEEIGARLASYDFSLTRGDVGAFLTRYQDRYVEDGWAESTQKKLRGVLFSVLAGAGFLASPRSSELRPVLLDPAVEAGIRRNGDSVLLAAFGGSYEQAMPDAASCASRAAASAAGVAE